MATVGRDEEAAAVAVEDSWQTARAFRSRMRVWRLIDRLGPLLTLVVILIGMSIAYPGFVTSANLMTIGTQATTRAILAIGVTLVIISGGIDLSVGTVMSLSMVVMGVFVINGSGPIEIGMLIAVLTGAFVGLINGSLIAFAGLPPFIVTLGMLGVAQGTALTLSQGYSMYGFPRSFEFIGGGTLLGIPFPLYILAAVGLVMAFILRQTKVGRYAYAIGGNEEAARRSGIWVAGFKVVFYVITGAMSGIASVVLASRIASAHPGVGFGYELDAIAAAVIGGASLMGGRGSVGGALIGALIMATIRFGLNVLGITPFIQQIVVGVILVAAVFLDTLRIRHEATLDRLRARG
jgi:ribose transport system permease protein